MKKMKAITLTLMLTVVLAGSAFANPLTTAGAGTSLFSFAVGQIVSFLQDSCPTRQCGTCHPNNASEDGNCRPE